MGECSKLCWSVAAPKLLVHVSLLLVIIAGAGVATLARLKWDPSTYMVFRTLLPDVYRVMSGVLCVATVMLIALAHLSVFALTLRDPRYLQRRRALFYTYAALMLALIIVELGSVAWLLSDIIAWISSGIPSDIYKSTVDIIKVGSRVLRVGSSIIGKRRKRAVDLSLLLNALDALQKSLAEILFDVPFNLLVGVAFIAAAAVLQPLAAILALIAACTLPKTTEGWGGAVTQVVHYVRYNSDKCKASVEIQNKDEKQKKPKSETKRKFYS